MIFCSLKKKSFLKRQKPLANPNRFVLKDDFYLRFFANLLLLVFICSVVLTTISLRDSLIEQKINILKEDFWNYTAKHGLSLEDIIIEGRDQTSLEDLKSQINLSRENNIANIDLQSVKSRIEDLPWIENVELKRTYFPNVLQIKLKEKDIIALYQVEGNFYPIDKSGAVIDVAYIPKKPYMIVVGKGGPEKFFELLEVVSTEPALQKRIKAAVLNSERRWDLIFDDIENGITVKMPEKNLLEAWQKLIKIQNKYGIFKRKLTFIDLRYTDKVTVRIAD